MQTDMRGLLLTTESGAAAGDIDTAVSDYLDYGVGASASLKSALERDPAFALAQCFRGYFMMMLEMRAVLPKVRQVLCDLESRLSSLTRREQLHVQALDAWSAGDIMRACAAWEEILADHPRDLLALKLHHTMTFYTGRSQVMRAVLEGVLGEWNADVPGYGYVQGMYAYALEECGDYAQSEQWGREAVERNHGDLWAIHAVTHVLEMQGRSKEGVAWLPYARNDWARKNPFKAHVWWHSALFHLAQGNSDRVLAIYDDELSSVNTDSYVDVSNQAALLKRLALAGVDVGERWHKLAEHSAKRIHDHILPFRDVHFCLALAAAGDIETARRHIESMRSFVGERTGWQSEVMRNVVIPLCEAIMLCEQGEHARACDLLWPRRHDLATIGGSNAQRDLFAQILCDAAVRGGRLTVARSLLSQRVRGRATRKANWQAYAEVLSALGETAEAKAALKHGELAIEAGA
jgi:tetratricopeptide (TPR) repeat protein